MMDISWDGFRKEVVRLYGIDFPIHPHNCEDCRWRTNVVTHLTIDTVCEVFSIGYISLTPEHCVDTLVWGCSSFCHKEESDNIYE